MPIYHTFQDISAYVRCLGFGEVEEATFSFHTWPLIHEASPKTKKLKRA